MPNEEVPDYLPDGTVNIHGKLARNLRVSIYKDKSGDTTVNVSDDRPSETEMLKRMNDAMDKAYRNE